MYFVFNTMNGRFLNSVHKTTGSISYSDFVDAKEFSSEEQIERTVEKINFERGERKFLVVLSFERKL